MEEAMSVRNSRIAKTPRKPFPPGVVRECQQYTIDEPYDVWSWDFAWRDPASGRLTQYNALAYAMPEMSETEFAERVRAPAVACIEREIHRKCGMAYAIANQFPLSLPLTAIKARFV
jgi:hypothetical protein